MKASKIALAAIAALSVGLTACETATPYQPLQHGTATSGGYSDQRLDQDHWRVSFQGNTETPRATVETFLLYRAAELTVSQGFDWFETAERHTDRDQRTYVDPDPFYGSGYGYGYGFFRPYWAFYGGGGFHRGFGRGFYGGGFYGGPFGGFDNGEIQTVQKFQATAEIVMHHGPKPQDNPHAFDARGVISNLGAKVQRPTT